MVSKQETDYQPCAFHVSASLQAVKTAPSEDG